MKCLFALASAVALAGPSLPDPPRWSDATPPARWQRVGLVPVIFVHPDDIPAACLPVGEPPTGMHVIACTRRIEVKGQILAVVVMPNPCAFAHVDPYAQVQCHENAHYLAGWQHETE